MRTILRFRGLALVVVACALGAPALADLDLNIPLGVTTGSREICVRRAALT